MCHLTFLVRLTFIRKQNFRLVQIGSICRRQFHNGSKGIFLLEMVENIVGKGENAGYQTFFFFSQNLPLCGKAYKN